MNIDFLILYTRSGCCLCEGLEERLKDISLQDLNPSLALKVIDIDRDDLSAIEKEKYDLIVPVMVLVLQETNFMIEIPRVSPRIKKQELFHWLQKTINNILSLNNCGT
tara:strand:- start:193 stop:516 length:324 start_codon:yes stop_codon:yes gene_type:complete